MDENVFLFFVILIFCYFIYHQYNFQKYVFMGSSLESFTPKEVNNIIQPPGANPIGTMDPKIWTSTQMKVVSNGYTNKDINNLKPSNPQPFVRETTDTLGNFPAGEDGKYILPTTEFEYPNDYKFTVKFPCRKTSTGMFSDCGTYSANTAWTANPYKGLNCKLNDTKTPKITNNVFNKRETEYGTPRKTGLSGTGNSSLR